MSTINCTLPILKFREFSICTPKYWNPSSSQARQMSRKRNAVEGRVYTLRSAAECEEDGIMCPVLPRGVRGHMVLVLDWAEERDWVRIMTVIFSLRQPDFIDIHRSHPLSRKTSNMSQSVQCPGRSNMEREDGQCSSDSARMDIVTSSFRSDRI